MAALKNAKHERFAQAYVHGKNAGNATKCYAEIYGTKAARQTAYKLLHRADIVTRLAELRQQIEDLEREANEAAAEKLGITRVWVLEQLRENVERAMQVKAVLDEDGKPIGQYKYEGAVANKALELLGRHLGMFVAAGDTVNNILNVGVQVIDRPPQETFKQWEARRLLELKPATNGSTGNGKSH